MTIDDEAVAAAPHGPRDEEELELMLSDPTPAVVEALRACPGDVVVLGAGGKMGPSLSRMLRRAAHDGRRVIAVSRFGSPHARERLEGWGVETTACDLADRAAVARLPDAPNVVYRSEEHTSELQSRGHLVCCLLLEKKKIIIMTDTLLNIKKIYQYPSTAVRPP